MNRVIKEYVLEILPYNYVEIPYNSKILSIQSFNDRPVVYAEVDEDQYLVDYVFVTFETNTIISNSFVGTYVGTYQVGLGSEIYHVYLETI